MPCLTTPSFVGLCWSYFRFPRAFRVALTRRDFLYDHPGSERYSPATSLHLACFRISPQRPVNSGLTSSPVIEAPKKGLGC